MTCPSENRCVLTFCDVCRVEAALDGVRTSPLRANHDVVSRLVPEVVAELARVFLPLSFHLQRGRVDERKRAFVVAAGVTKRAYHDVAVRQAVRRVRHRAVEGVVDDIRFDHGEVSRCAWLGADIDEVDAVATQRRKYESVARLARVVMTTGAGVPTRMMQFVANIRHGQTMNDLNWKDKLKVNVKVKCKHGVVGQRTCEYVGEAGSTSTVAR